MFGIDTLIYIALAASLIGTGVSAYSAIQQGQAQQDAAKANAQAANNAAENAQAVAAEDANRQREANLRRLGAIKGKIVASGVTIGGSSLDALSTSASDMELGVMDAFNSAEGQARQYQNQAQIDLWSGQNAADSGLLSGLGTLIGGVGSAGVNYYNSQKFQTGGAKVSSTPYATVR